MSAATEVDKKLLSTSPAASLAQNPSDAGVFRAAHSSRRRKSESHRLKVNMGGLSI